MLLLRMTAKEPRVRNRCLMEAEEPYLVIPIWISVTMGAAWLILHSVHATLSTEAHAHDQLSLR